MAVDTSFCLDSLFGNVLPFSSFCVLCLGPICVSSHCFDQGFSLAKLNEDELRTGRPLMKQCMG